MGSVTDRATHTFDNLCVRDCGVLPENQYDVPYGTAYCGRNSPSYANGLNIILCAALSTLLPVLVLSGFGVTYLREVTISAAPPLQIGSYRFVGFPDINQSLVTNYRVTQLIQLLQTTPTR